MQFAGNARPLPEAGILLCQSLPTRHALCQLPCHTIKLGFELSNLVVARDGDAQCIIARGNMRCGCYQLLHTLDDPSRGDDAKQSSQQGSRHHGQHDHHQRPLPGITCKLRLMEIVPPLGGCVVQLISKEATIQGKDDEDNTNRCPCIRALHRGGKSITPSPNMQPPPQMSIFALHHILTAPSRVWLFFLLKHCTHHTSSIHRGTNLNYTLSG